MFYVTLGVVPPFKVESGPHERLEDAIAACPPGRSIIDGATGKYKNMDFNLKGRVEWLNVQDYVAAQNQELGE